MARGVATDAGRARTITVYTDVARAVRELGLAALTRSASCSSTARAASLPANAAAWTTRRRCGSRGPLRDPRRRRARRGGAARGRRGSRECLLRHSRDGARATQRWLRATRAAERAELRRDGQSGKELPRVVYRGGAVPEGRSRRRARVCWRQVHRQRPRREAPVRRSLAVIAMVVGTSIASPLLASERAGGPGVNSRCVGGTARRSAVPLPPARDGAASRARDARDARGRSRLGGRQRRDARGPGGRPAPSADCDRIGLPSAAG